MNIYTSHPRSAAPLYPTIKSATNSNRANVSDCWLRVAGGRRNVCGRPALFELANISASRCELRKLPKWWAYQRNRNVLRPEKRIKYPPSFMWRSQSNPQVDGHRLTHLSF